MRAPQVFVLCMVVAGLSGYALHSGMSRAPWLHALFLASCSTLLAIGVHTCSRKLMRQIAGEIENAERESMRRGESGSPCRSELDPDDRPRERQRNADYPRE